ncbi:MAG: Gfo/Idh/MocA family oxidoreductase [Planctomycetes bacterium]|nr:Gfo/Idh/MocA family oxidoreductase [Planctomycetota bacterium]
MSERQFESRRGFLKGSTAALAGTALAGSLNLGVARTAHAQGSDQIKAALIGCGGRGNGAVQNYLNATENTKIVAVADAFEDKAQGAANRWRGNPKYKDRIDISDDRVFWGLDAYKKAIDSGIDMIIVATPPGFRPVHYKAAVEAGKHVFMEKPCCVDAPGYRTLVEANKMADEKGLKVGVGLQRRHNKGYVRGIQEIHDGKYGDLILLQAYWNGGGIWWRSGQEGWTEMQKQVNNWYHFCWLSGDNICEQHVHNLDVCNWAKDAHPAEANGMGGGEVRAMDNPGGTEIFDHHFVEFTYPDGSKMYSQCRHVKNTFGSVSEHAFGTQGRGGMTANGDITDRGGVEFKFGDYDQEHYALVEAIRNGTPYNEGHYGATSSFTAVLGRMATYSGKVIKWDEAVEKGKQEAPGIETFTMESEAPVQPNEDGTYDHPIPGRYNPFA